MEQRQSAAVAEVSRRLRADGARVCLFTDQANPTSNRIYQAIGFVPVVDMANLVVTPCGSRPTPRTGPDSAPPGHPPAPP